jgi:glucose dehydrogenase
MNSPHGMQPFFKTKMDKMLAAAHAEGHNLSVFSGYRSQAHQDALFARSDHSRETWTCPFVGSYEINAQNVKNLKVAFAFSTGLDRGEEAALVVGDMM